MFKCYRYLPEGFEWKNKCQGSVINGQASKYLATENNRSTETATATAN